MTKDEHAQPVFPLPVRGDTYLRADAELVDQMGQVSSATACAKLHGLGIRRTWMEGPQPLTTGQKIAGSALTLQFMPQREDIASGLAQEAVERQTALWAVLEAVQPGDVLVIQAYGSAFSGCVGDMLVRYFKRKGGAGIVVDGRIRDAPRVRELGVPIWCTGTTPHYASQSELFPWAYDVPVAAGGVLCLPGDIVVADDDGAVVVPQATAPEVVATARDHQDWEVFSRMRLDQGARLGNYYPLTSESRAEYEQWRDQQRSSQR
ncbi:ribonuclease activity regulator RraA [Streptomyces sp. NBC_00825]|uniref:RraA family protein n=1 Tax=unclassified Streptomyces TaxID=2593676 RepID=UPI0022575002|nr:MULTISPECIES: ribonuclease activity regulator RraA [unclassified Streptomyces]WTB51836.1 ribonuclease activity regulator RraA [Streptomyces sp. NBC_00826]WTH95271.1 ribonuclease activity regulator RraA [Streptomyces sp. NBC_00825]WTI04005.1 ribonuclease activity regulator RraA [Streptomyces sp. NBC_00822]MCX4869598.1 ribonuclease activity regulator RraA [Streptomyces sp. NBC_00906]MCX4900837.1 ribonuclease activity regulator RraA [Streptomyces sp. NBC_00892]